MDVDASLKFVVGEIERELRAFRGRQEYNRRATFAFTVGSASLSAIGTVLIGAAEVVTTVPALPILAMATTAIAAVLGAWSGLFANRKMWITAGKTVCGLEALQRDVSFRLHQGAPVTGDEVNGYYERHAALIVAAEESWAATFAQ